MKRDKEKEVVLCAPPALLLPWGRGSSVRQGLQLPDRSRQDNRGLPPPGVQACVRGSFSSTPTLRGRWR